MGGRRARRVCRVATKRVHDGREAMWGGVPSETPTGTLAASRQQGSAAVRNNSESVGWSVVLTL
eukprot:8516885-Pyramimonas_sp.AAC.1